MPTTNTISRVSKEKMDDEALFNRIRQAFGEETAIWVNHHHVLDIIEVRMWNASLSVEENRAIFTLFNAWWEHFAKNNYPDHLVLLSEPEMSWENAMDASETTPFFNEV